MFERMRIQTSLNRACVVLAREGARISRGHIRYLTRDVIDLAINDMKKIGLKGDQAAAALIVNLVNGLHEVGALKDLFDKEYEHYICLYWVYCYYYNRIFERPDYFFRAKLLVDQNVFKDMNSF
jgi:hypothetical protein